MTSSWRDRLPKSSAVITVLAAVLVILVTLLVKQIPDSAVTIEVELTSGRPGTAELFVNGADQWKQASVGQGRQTISFPDVDGPLSAIRIDPLAWAGERITIHRVSVYESNHDLIASFAGFDFSAWISHSAEDVAVGADGLTLTTGTADTAVTSNVDIRTTDRARIVDFLVQRWRQPFPATELVLGLPVAILALGAVYRRRLGAIALVIGPVAAYLALRLTGTPLGDTAADQAFGRPGWSGLDASYPQRFLTFALALVVALSLVALVARRQFPSLRRTATPLAEHNVPDDDVSQPDVSADSEVLDTGDSDDRLANDSVRTRVTACLRRLQWVRLITILIVPLLYALIRVPSADQISAELSGPISSFDWDYTNLRVWDHFLSVGKHPMEDFWYPYGNLGYLRQGVIGAVIDWLASTICLTAFSSSLWRLSRHATPVIVGTIAVAAFDLQVFTGGLRYLAPLAFTTWFATTRRSTGRERWAALTAVAIAPLIAPDVGVYTLAAALCVLVADELAVRGLGDQSSRRRILRDCIAIASGWSVFIVIGLLRGSLVPSLALILDTGSTAAYVGAISRVEVSIEVMPGFIAYLFPFVLIALALYGALRRHGRNLNLSWIPAFAGLGIFGVLALAKHLIRPGLLGVLSMICAGAIAVAIAATWKRFGSPTSSIAAGVLIGALLLQAKAIGSFERWESALEKAPSRSVDLLAAFTWEREEAVLFDATITRERMAGFPDELAVADAIAALTPNGRMYVLGDAQYLYALNDHDPYWSISGWDASPFREQTRVVDDLADDPPDVIVFDPRDFEFDAVPSELRLPLIYGWVVEHYSPHSSSGPYELLTPRDRDDEIDWAYWREMLGTTLDMGRLPAATTASGASCELDHNASNEHCLAYLTLEVEAVDVLVGRTITLSGPSGFFRLTFLQQPGDRELTVPVGRMWFWTDESKVFVPTDWVIDYEMHGNRDSVLY